MRVVIDTNTFISAVLIDKSIPALALSLAMQRGTLLKSAATKTLLLAVVKWPRSAPLILAAGSNLFLSQFASAENVDVRERITDCPHTTDDKFLDIAINDQADHILSGDADLRILNPFRHIPIPNPADFEKLICL